MGAASNGPGELKQIVLQQRDAFTQGLTEKMLTYALGRGVERYDRQVIREIAGRTATDNYRISHGWITADRPQPAIPEPEKSRLEV
jgi:hypothetical protein